MEYIRSFETMTEADAPAVGWKAVNLSRMRRAGLPVPPGFCVTTNAFRAWLGPASFAAVPDAPLPAAVAGEMAAAIAALGGAGAFAVRSSAIAEDLPTASFAGQYDSFLNVPAGPPLLDAVRNCWRSVFCGRAQSYRRRRELDADHAEMAVIVQRFVTAECAGVIFTADPVTGATDVMIIEGCFGLGETAVRGGAVDRVVVDRVSGVVRDRAAGGQEELVEADPAGGTRTRTRAAAPGETCLAPELVARLVTLARAAEELFGAPQDLEWAAAAGEAYLLQARAITTGVNNPITHTPSPGSDRTVWSNLNVGEVLPDVVTPLTWSVIEYSIRHLFAPLLRWVVFDLERNPFAGLKAGRVYANVSVFAQMSRAIPGIGDTRLAARFGGRQEQEHVAAALAAARERVGWFRQLTFLGGLAVIFTWFFLVWLVSDGPALMAVLRRRMDELHRCDLNAMTDTELLQTGRTTMVENLRSFQAIAAVAGGLGAAIKLYRVTRRRLGDETGALAGRLLGHAGEMASADAGRALWQLAVAARSHPAVATIVLGGGSFAAVSARLATVPGGAEFLAGWAATMFRHGHHTRGELELHNPRWVEQPDYVLELVRGCLQADDRHDFAARERDRTAARDRLFNDCLARLGPFRRWCFARLVRHARAGLALRENFKSEAVRLMVYLRRAALELGARLQARGVLAGADDIFFLTLDEAETLAAGTFPGAPAPLLARRRAEYERNLNTTPPPVIVGNFIPAALAAATLPASGEWRGLGVSPGVVTGPARVILRADTTERVLPGEILVAPFTDPGWTPYFLTAAGIVMDLGGMLSHGCIVAREYGIPAVVNVGPATKQITTGTILTVDGDHGVVTIHPSGVTTQKV